MPSEKIRGWLFGIVPWQYQQSFPMMGIVVPTILVLLLDPATDFDTILRSNGHVTAIEKNMQVRTQQEPVRDAMWALFCVRPDMCGLQYG